MTVYDDRNDVMIHLMPLPGNICAFSIPCGDGYTVVINDYMSPNAKKKAFEHELNHIKHGDHYNPDYQEYI